MITLNKKQAILKIQMKVQTILKKLKKKKQNKPFKILITVKVQKRQKKKKTQSIENTLEKIIHVKEPIKNDKINALDKNLKSDSDELEMVEFNFNNIIDTIKIKKPNEVYYEIYKVAREKAKLAKKLAIEAYLEAQNIKTKYMLDDLDESDEDEMNI